MTGTARTKLLLVAAMLIALGAVAPFANSFVLLLLTKVLVLSILAMSAVLLLGYTGLATMGQAAYLAVGAYLVAFLAVRHPIGLWCDFVALLARGALLGAQPPGGLEA